MKRTSIICAFLVAAGGIALAQGKDKPAAAKEGAPPPAAIGPPRPSPELTTQLKFWVGKWSCEGTDFASPMGPEHKVKSIGTFKMDLGNFWLSYRIEQQKTKENPMAMAVNGFGTHDGKQLVRFDTDSMGGWATMTSPGWDGDKVVFSGDMHMGEKKIPVRHTMTKAGEKEFSGIFEIGTPDGKMAKLSDEKCKKK